jgi:hypothetical protein
MRKPIDGPTLFVVEQPKAPEYHAYEDKVRELRPPTVLEEQVIVEPCIDGRFVVSLLRHHGTSIAAVKYSKAQLQMLIERAREALER